GERRGHGAAGAVSSAAATSTGDRASRTTPHPPITTPASAPTTRDGLDSTVSANTVTPTIAETIGPVVVIVVCTAARRPDRSATFWITTAARVAATTAHGLHDVRKPATLKPSPTNAI